MGRHEDQDINPVPPDCPEFWNVRLSHLGVGEFTTLHRLVYERLTDEQRAEVERYAAQRLAARVMTGSALDVEDTPPMRDHMRRALWEALPEPTASTKKRLDAYLAKLDRV